MNDTINSSVELDLIGIEDEYYVVKYPNLDIPISIEKDIYHRWFSNQSN